MKVKKLITLMTLLVFVTGVPVFHAQPRTAASSPITFTLTAPGVALESDMLLAAASLNNTSRRPAYKVTIDSARLDTARALTPTFISTDDIDANRSATVQANFNSRQLTKAKQHTLVVNGSYQATQNGPRLRFTVRTVIVLPAAAPGSSTVKKVTVPARRVKGAPYPRQLPKPRSLDQVNGPRWTVPTGRFVPGAPTKDGTQVKSASSVGSTLLGNGSVFQNARYAAGPIVFLENNSTNLTGASTTSEPSGGSNGRGVVFATANWLAGYSTDGGNTFTQLDPTTIFPNDAVGFCCDQIVQYVPSIDRFVWLLQGNGYRLAMASPADIVSSGGTAWTYWNLTPNVFGACAGFDYPDVSVGSNSIYMGWDAGFGGCSGGFQVVRTSSAGIAAGGTITLEFTDPALGTMAWGSHVMQNTGDEIFWAGHNSNSNMRVFSLAEGSGTYFWRDVGISSWPNNAPTSTTPDGRDWLAKNFNGPGGNSFPRNGIIGTTRVGNQLWFAWTAGTDRNFRQAHIQMVTLNRTSSFSVTQQVQIWNPDYAFAYPALATNACTREVGLSFEFGGGGNYENHVVGFWGDFIAYITTGSNVGTTRFGDYVTIRQEPPTDKNRGNLFNAYGYGLNSVQPNGVRSDIHYVLFGRPASSCRGN